MYLSSKRTSDTSAARAVRLGQGPSHSGDRCCAVGVHPYLDDLGVVDRKHLVGMRSASTLGYWVEYRLDVDYGGAVERFEFADQDPQALHGEDLGPVQADWVGPVG